MRAAAASGAAALLALGVTSPATAQIDNQWVTFHKDNSLLESPGSVGVSDSEEKDYAWGDVDKDGDIDLVIVDGSTLERVAAGEPGLPPRLFLNDGSGRFALATGPWSMSGGRWGTGVAVGDVNGDGDLDAVAASRAAAPGAQIFLGE